MFGVPRTPSARAFSAYQAAPDAGSFWMSAAVTRMAPDGGAIVAAGPGFVGAGVGVAAGVGVGVTAGVGVGVGVAVGVAVGVGVGVGAAVGVGDAVDVGVAT